MLDKIKISVSKSTYDILIKDCQNFGFYKNEESLNKNLFLNTLIVNYSDRFNANEEVFKDSLLKVIENINDDQDMLLEKIINAVRNNENKQLDSKTEIINLKPTKLSEKQILFTLNNLINNSSISSYYRNLFTSYTNIVQNNRELIIFKENYELLINSINKNRKVSISLTTGEVINDASIYKVEASKEELFNYVLFCNPNNKPITIRLSKIKYITLLNSKREIPDDVSDIFNKQIIYGVEYPFNSSFEKDVIVKLSSNGKRLFKKIYLYRPIPYKIEDNLYYFNCSHNQVMYYFKRFGYDAVIISPLEVTEAMKDFYYISSRKYDKILLKEKIRVKK